MRFNQVSAVTVVLGLLLTVAGCSSPPGTEPEGSTSSEAIEQFEHYVEAVNADDADAVAAVIGRPVTHDDVQDRLQHHGGKGLTDLQTDARSEFADVYQIWWEATGSSGQQVEGYEVLEMTDGEWTFAPLYTGRPPGHLPD